VRRRILVVGLLAAGCSGGTANVGGGSAGTPDAGASDTTIVNVWSGATVDPTKLPLGDSLVTKTGPAKDHLYVCSSGPGGPAGASSAGPWIDQADGTWDLTQKLSVTGEKSWPAAQYGESVSGSVRTLVTNGLPVATLTGTFPIAPSDPAYKYDRNPNTISSVSLKYALPVSPTAAASPSCLPMGAIGLLRNGVAIFAPVDEGLRDAVAWETQDSCQGHPQMQGEYHYHDVSSCLQSATTGSSTVVGWAADGYPIVVERDAQSRLPTNVDLDECHGRTSPVLLDGTVVTTYHYSATLEFPYALGCFHAAPTAAQH
jgi:hypothetical protein